MQQFHGFLKKKHEIAKAVQEVTDFLDSPSCRGTWNASGSFSLSGKIAVKRLFFKLPVWAVI
jgi:hypothetical protein